MRIFLILIITFSISCKRNYRGIPNNNREIKDGIREENNGLENKKDHYFKENSDSRTDDITSLFEKLEKSVFMLYGFDSKNNRYQASGFLIGPDIGISNFHFLRADYQDVRVVVNENVFSISEILDYSHTEELDYFIFRIEGIRGTPLKLAAERPKIGEDVFAIGSPQGLANSLTKGSISGYRSNSRLQFDATIDHGSSGGPLFNYSGEVVGITSAGVDSGKELNFAIDIQQIPLWKFFNKWDDS